MSEIALASRDASRTFGGLSRFMQGVSRSGGHRREAGPRSPAELIRTER